MKKISIIFAIIVCSLLVASCDQEQSKLSQLHTEDSKTFPESNGQMWTKLYYKWRNDKILYRYSFGPYSDEIQKALITPNYLTLSEIETFHPSSITLNFLDKDGFSVVHQSILLSSFLMRVDEHGLPAYWEKVGEISCSKDDYMLITSNSVSWSFTKSLKEAIKRYAKVLKKKHADNWNRLKE